MSVALNGTLRTNTGRKSSRDIRGEGMMPAIVYGQKDNISFSVNPKELAKLIKQKGKNIVIDLVIAEDSSPKRKVLLKEFQSHPLRETWIHADFIEIDMTKPLKVQVPIKLTGVSPGEKKGGVLNHAIRNIQLECLPDDIPEAIEVSISELDMEQAIHVSDLDLPKHLKILNPPSATIAVVHAEKIEAEPETEGEEEGEAAEGAAPAASAESEKDKKTEEK